ncbi:nucleoside 2-deoxyribosyltransferase [Labrenzia sp. EL_126]|nr:nucleoside 2-deoxyribosyltransferase [Labrenzia sp. EL_126]
MKIYLASRYSRAPELREIRRQLQEMGHEVTSRWLDGGHEIKPGGSDQAADDERARFAREDWSDMEAADCVVSFTEEPRKTNTRGGRHVEFGGALALGKKCVVIGWQENVFHHMQQVEFHPNWASASLHFAGTGQTVEAVKQKASEFELVSINFLDKKGRIARQSNKVVSVEMSFIDGTKMSLPAADFAELDNFQFKLRPARPDA